MSASRTETPLTGRALYGCNCYASGEELYEENVIVKSWGSMLDWFNILHANPTFAEVNVDIEETENNQDSEGW